VVTVKEAAAVVTAYEETNNRANARRDAKLLASVEAGQLNVQSQADYEQFRTWPKKKQAYYGSGFRYTHREYLIPRKGAASWFAVRATASGAQAGSASLLVFDQVGGAFKLVLAVYAEKTPLPRVAVDKNGFVTPADPGERVGSLAPAELGAAFEDLVETGGKKSGAELASTPVVKDAVKLYADRDRRDNSRYATNRFFAKPAKDPSVYALRLAGGGVLVAFPSAHTLETMLRPAYRSSYKINPDTEEAVYNREGRVVITDEFQGQALATLSPSGKARVLAREYRMVDSR
jgi:hypothetical protein